MKRTLSSHFRHTTLGVALGLSAFGLVTLSSCRDTLSPGPKDPVDTTHSTAGSWTQIPAGIQYDVQALHAFNSTNAMNVDGSGMGGLIIHSTDGGVSWVQQNSGTTENLYDIGYVGPLGIAVGNNATVLRTTDYGATWTPIDVSSAMKSYENLRKVVVYDQKYMFAVGGYQGVDAVAIQSGDGGQTWERIPVGPATALYGLSVKNPGDYELSGLNGDQAVFFHTRDFGTTWTTESLPGYILDEAYSANGVGIAVGPYGSMFRKLPGTTWTKLTSPTSEDLRHVEFITNTEVYAVGANNVVLHSTDAGQSWTSETVSPSSTWNGMAVVSANKQILAGNGGILLQRTK